MGSGVKKKSNYKGLTHAFNKCYTANKDADIWHKYCIDNDIRISPVPTETGMFPEEWRISVCLGPYKRGEKAYISPNVYTIHNIHQQLEISKKYYYDKRND